MYRKLPNLVLGFHGCHRDVFKNVIYEGQPLKASSNSYDWLGNGIYFWNRIMRELLNGQKIDMMSTVL